jgi:TRAP-type mannitol/chloroaromatic compound transport system permease small subunit
LHGPGSKRSFPSPVPRETRTNRQVSRENKMERFFHWVDWINGWTGRVVGHLLILMMFFMTFEVVMRYLFNSPTLWVNETNQYLSVVLISLGAGYVLQNKGHVNVDVFYSRFGERTRAVLDLLTSPIFFIFVIVVVWQTIDGAAESWQYREHSPVAEIPTYPVRMIMVAGAFLILLQGIAKFGRDFRKARTKEFPGGRKEQKDERGERQR